MLKNYIVMCCEIMYLLTKELYQTCTCINIIIEKLKDKLKFHRKIDLTDSASKTTIFHIYNTSTSNKNHYHLLYNNILFKFYGVKICFNI